MSSSSTCSYPAAISAGNSSSIPSGLFSRFSRSTEFRLRTSSRVGASEALAAMRTLRFRRGSQPASAGDQPERTTHANRCVGDQDAEPTSNTSKSKVMLGTPTTCGRCRKKCVHRVVVSVLRQRRGLDERLEPAPQLVGCREHLV